MKAAIATMDGHRTTVQQKLMSAAPPQPVELEDETVEDEPNIQEMEDENVAHPDMVIDGTPAIEEPATPVGVEMVSQNEATTQDEDDDMVAITQPPKDAKRVAMPPPPPRPSRSNAYEASTIILESVQAPTTITTPETQCAAAPKPPEIQADVQPIPPPSATTPMDESERETLLRQLDLLRVKFKQSVIPTRVYCNICMPWHHRTLKPRRHPRCDSLWNGTSQISSGRGTSPCTAHTSSSPT